MSFFTNELFLFDFNKKKSV